MKKRISDFLLDVSKYVFAGLLIAPLFNSSFMCNEACWCAFIVAILALIVGLFLPFKMLVNYIYVLNGYVGALLIVFMLWKNIKDTFLKKKEA